MAARYIIIIFPASINPAARMAKKMPETISRVLLLKCFEILENKNMTDMELENERSWGKSNCYL